MLDNKDKMYELEMYVLKSRRFKLETRVVGHPINGLIVPVMRKASVN